MAAPFIDFSVLKEMTMREGDVFISTGAKQGTTWTSCIPLVEQERRRGGKEERRRGEEVIMEGGVDKELARRVN